MDLKSRINCLTDEQALSVLAALSGEFANAKTPETEADQEEVVTNLMCQQGLAPETILPERPDQPTAASAARQLLALMAEVPEMRDSLANRLERPPMRETLGVETLLLAPVVLTGCIVLLQVVGHVQISIADNGKWWVRYDPQMDTAMGRKLGDLVKALTDLMRTLSRGG